VKRKNEIENKTNRQKGDENKKHWKPDLSGSFRSSFLFLCGLKERETKRETSANRKKKKREKTTPLSLHALFVFPQIPHTAHAYSHTKKRKKEKEAGEDKKKKKWDVGFGENSFPVAYLSSCQRAFPFPGLA
jgi:hypothetical protein